MGLGPWALALGGAWAFVLGPSLAFALAWVFFREGFAHALPRPPCRAHLNQHPLSPSRVGALKGKKGEGGGGVTSGFFIPSPLGFARTRALNSPAAPRLYESIQIAVG